MLAAELFARDFATLPDLIRAQAAERPHAVALAHHDDQLTYAELDRLIDRVAAALQRDGVAPGGAVAICAQSSIAYVAVFMGVLRAGLAAAPLAPSSTPESLAGMVADAGAPLLFLDAMVAAHLAGTPTPGVTRIALDGSSAGLPLDAWLADPDARPAPVAIAPEQPFNIIYSSGTTGAPKGIVQSHRMRWSHVGRAGQGQYGPDAVTIVSTPLYSNTTLVSLIPTLAAGGLAVLMEKFDAQGFLALAERRRATHAMLVPVQYRRLMALADFDRYDLSSFRMKFSTSAPFPATLKAEVLSRWPGGLIEYFGMTEGGCTFVLAAHEHPDKLHTVGRPAPGHDVRLIDEDGRELAQPGAIGEIVGHSPAMMTGYHNQPDKTAQAEWRDAAGKRFIRTGDVGRLDEDGFLTLMDRKKDMIISGGFNVYPSDLEAELAAHEAVLEAAVVGVPSDAWGETPIALVVLKPGADVDAEVLRAWVNARLGKTQRLAALALLPALPRSAIGKVLKRELRDRYAGLVAG
jgi:long-chain acyl-CoA synthetase